MAVSVEFAARARDVESVNKVAWRVVNFILDVISYISSLSYWQRGFDLGVSINSASLGQGLIVEI